MEHDGSDDEKDVDCYPDRFVWHFKGFDLHKLCLLGLRVCCRRTGLRLLRMLGVGEKASEAADDAHAAQSRPRGKLQQLLDQLCELWGQRRHGQSGRGEVIVMHQLPAALHTLSNKRESKQKALYWSANVWN